jgi:hypothetical protein
MAPTDHSGWGDLSLTKQDEGRTPAPPASRRAAQKSKIDMFSVLQLRNPKNESDAWFGHTSIDPSAGKRAVQPPSDPKGRKNLFQVLNQVEPAPPSSDSWMGNQLIDPGKGKRHCVGPEQRLGRPNLFSLMQQVSQVRTLSFNCSAGYLH